MEDKKNYSKPNYDLLAALPENYRKTALWEMYRESIISDPKIAEEFLSSVKLSEIGEESKEAASNLLKGIRNSFPEEFEDNLRYNDEGIVLYEEPYLVVGKTDLYKDEAGEEWVLFFSVIPMMFEIEDRDDSLESHLNDLNSRSIIGAWVNFYNEEENTDNIALLSGFTMKRRHWTRDSDLYASNLMLQSLAYVTEVQSETKTIGKAESQQKIWNIEYENSNQKTSAELITKSLSDYKNKLRKELQIALTIEPVDKGYVIKVPLKGHIRHAMAELYIIEYENNVMGKGMLLGACLPGMLGKTSSIKMANRLNFDMDQEETIHTTPKLAGAWHASQMEDDSEWYNLYYNSFIPFNEPSNFSRFMHIEGLVREVTTSWPKVDTEIQFNSIVREGSENV